MGDSITNYTFSIIEDEMVPLAGDFDKVTKVPTLAVVIICLVILAICSYSMWVYTKISRIMEYTDESTFTLLIKYYFRPQHLKEACEECEHNALSGNVI